MKHSSLIVYLIDTGIAIGFGYCLGVYHSSKPTEEKKEKKKRVRLENGKLVIEM